MSSSDRADLIALRLERGYELESIHRTVVKARRGTKLFPRCRPRLQIDHWRITGARLSGLARLVERGGELLTSSTESFPSLVAFCICCEHRERARRRSIVPVGDRVAHVEQRLPERSFAAGATPSSNIRDASELSCPNEIATSFASPPA